MSNPPKLILKIIVLGDSSVGKTALINRYVNQNFSGNFKATIGTDLASKQIFINNQLVTLQVSWKLTSFLFLNEFLVTDMGYGRTRTFPIFGGILLSRCWLCSTSLWCDIAKFIQKSWIVVWGVHDTLMSRKSRKFSFRFDREQSGLEKSSGM